MTRNVIAISVLGLFTYGLYADKLVMNDDTILEGQIISDRYGRIEFQTRDRLRFIEKSDVKQIIWSDRQIQLSKWGLGFDIGTGYGFFTGQIKNYFTSNVPLFVGFDIGYESLRLQLRDYIGLGMSTKQAFNYNGNWQQGLATNIVHPEASIGYEFKLGSSFAFIPFVGIASMDISPPSKVKEMPGNDVSLPFSTAIPIGTNFEYHFADHTDSANKVDGTLAAYWVVRLRVAYVICTFDGYDPRFSGDMVYFTVSFGGYLRARKFVEKPKVEDI